MTDPADDLSATAPGERPPAAGGGRGPGWHGHRWLSGRQLRSRQLPARQPGTADAPVHPARPRRRLPGRAVRVVAALALAAAGLAGCATAGGTKAASADVDGENGNGPVSTVTTPVAPQTMPPDLTPPPSTPCSKTVRPAGWLAAENKLPGTPGWQVNEDNGSRPVMGWTDKVSAACGESFGLHLSGSGGPTPILVYRIGWYGGVGARLVDTLPPVVAPVHPAPPKDEKAPLYTVETDWPTSTTITVPPSWTPGYYLLEVGPESDRYAIPFVVRNDAASDPLLFQASVLTYQAYNGYGGYSLYQGHDVSSARTDRSRMSSFDRPYAGSGYAAPFWYDIPMIQRIEQDGIDTDYTTDVDVDLRPSQLLRHHGLVIGGHSEYWTTRMYDAAEAARDKGVNIAFFGANVVYWHARLDASPTGVDRHITVYRVLAEDPQAAKDPSAATVEWRESPLDRPEQQLVGSTYGGLGIVGSYRVLTPSSWLFAGTGVRAGDVLRNAVGGEYDRVPADDPLVPADIDVAAAAPIVVGSMPTMATMSYYTAASGGGVFSAGTTYWPCELSGHCYQMTVDPHTRQVLETVTDTVLHAFAAGPAGRAHPAQPSPPPNPEYLVSTAAAESDVAVDP